MRRGLDWERRRREERMRIDKKIGREEEKRRMRRERGEDRRV